MFKNIHTFKTLLLQKLKPLNGFNFKNKPKLPNKPFNILNPPPPFNFFPSKFNNLNNKAFSLVELLTVVGILLVLASLAIVNYKKYQTHSKKQLILSNLDLIHSGFKTCMKVRYKFDKCNSLSKLKLQAPLNSTISTDLNDPKICFLIVLGGLKGCVDSSNNQTKKAQLDSQTVNTACNNGVCTP